MAVKQAEQSGGEHAPDAATATAAHAELETAVRQYQVVLIHYARQMLPDRPDQAQDVVQDAFLRLRKALLNGTRIRSTRNWLFRVAHNLTVDLNRRENRSTELQEPMIQTWTDTSGFANAPRDPGAVFSEKEARELALRELQRLPDAEKQILLLKLFERLTLREISEITGTSIATVHYRMGCGLRTLTKRFKTLGAI